MKLKRLTIENFMRLVAVDITPKGNAILITGKNGAGKSSIIEAIKALFQGKKYHPDKPIRDGEDHAEIIGETENFIIKRTFTKAGGGQVTVTNADGMKASSVQGLLAKFYGEFAFEPTSFYKDCKVVKKQREQLYTLMKLVGLDFDDINTAIKEVKEKRSAVKTSKETYDFEAGQIGELVNMPTELVSMVELTEKLTVATRLNAKHTETVQQIDVGQGEIERHEECLVNSEKRIAAVKEQLAVEEKELLAGKETLVNLQAKQEALVTTLDPLIDVATINQEIADADAHNDNIRLTNQRKELVKKSAAKSKEFALLGKDIKAWEAKKTERLAAVKMPIEGLSVNDETILFNDPKEQTGDIPLAQVNDSMQLQISVAISMALNPKLHVILVKGNDLDEANLETVCRMADEKDYQVWIERIRGGGQTGFHIEDGSVVEADIEDGNVEAADKDVLFKDKE